MNNSNEIYDLINKHNKNNKLILCDKNIKDSHIQYFKDILTNTINIIEIDLSKNNITSNGIQTLSNYLRKNISVCNVSLKCNKIDDSGFKFLCDLYCQYTRFTELNIDSNYITDDSALDLFKLIRESKIKKLYMNKNNLRVMSAQSIGNALKDGYLEELGLNNNDIGDIGVVNIANGIKENKSLKVLGLNSNFISGNALKPFYEALKMNNTLECIDLGGNNIGDEGCKWIGEIIKCTTSITELFIDDNKITCEGVSFIANSLKKNKSLIVLDLCKNNIGDKGFEVLCKALQHHKLQSLNLAGNNIGKSENKSIGNQLKYVECLEQLDLSDNYLGEDGIGAIFVAIYNRKQISSLYFSNNKLNDYSCFNRLKGNTNLREISFGEELLTETAASNISQILKTCNIETLKFNFNWMDLYNLEEIINNGILNNKNLKNVIFSDGITKDMIEYIADICIRNPNLNIEVELLDVELKHIIDKQTGLMNRTENNAILELLKNGLNDSKKIDLGYVIPSIKTEGDINALCEVLKRNSQIHSLNLSGNEINDEAVRLLCDALSSNTLLADLYLSRNKLTHRGVEYIRDFLVNSNLKKLWLSCNTIGQKGAYYLSEALNNNGYLEHLYLNKTDINDEGAESIANILGNNKCLQLLDLAENDITDIGGKKLAKILYNNNCSLKSLWLQSTNITDKTLKLFANVFKNNETFSELDIHKCNYVTKSSIKLLSNVYKHRKNPEDIHIIVPDKLVDYFNKLREEIVVSTTNSTLKRSKVKEKTKHIQSESRPTKHMQSETIHLENSNRIVDLIDNSNKEDQTNRAASISSSQVWSPKEYNRCGGCSKCGSIANCTCSVIIIDKDSQMNVVAISDTYFVAKAISAVGRLPNDGDRKWYLIEWKDKESEPSWEPFDFVNKTCKDLLGHIESNHVWELEVVPELLKRPRIPDDVSELSSIQPIIPKNTSIRKSKRVLLSDTDNDTVSTANTPTRRKRKAKNNSSSKGSVTKKNKPIVEKTDVDENNNWEVEDILQHAKNGSVTYYEVKWKGWNDTTWEPKGNLTGCKELLRQYEKRIKKRKR